MSSNMSGALVQRPPSTLLVCVTLGKQFAHHRSIFLYQVALGQNGDEDPCKKVVCPRGQMCVPLMDNGVKRTICQCPKTCPPESVNEPVCSYYNREFNSRCEMHKYACAHDLTMKVKNQGNCPSESKHNNCYGRRKHDEESPIPRLSIPMSPMLCLLRRAGNPKAARVITGRTLAYFFVSPTGCASEPKAGPLLTLVEYIFFDS